MKQEKTWWDIFEDGHIVIDRKIPNQLHEETHICHIVEKVRITELLRSLISKGLLVLTRAFTVALYNWVLDHLALDAFEILKLITHFSSVAKIYQSSFNKTLVQGTLTVLATPLSTFLVKVGIAANVHVRWNLAHVTYDVRNNQYQRWFVALHYLRCKLFFTDYF